MNNELTDDQKLGFVMMMDLSGSMDRVLPMVKIDSKAFVRCARVGDQFGANAFSDNAWWVYPSGSDPDIVTVTPGLKETEAAVQLIEKLNTHNLTNIGDAIKLGNQMIKKSSSALKAFVLLSDGYHNTGPDPHLVLENEPPIYIAGLGILDMRYFNEMVKKNPKSRFYNSPNAYEMMLIFNQILSDSSDINLTMNSLKKYNAGSDYILEPFGITEDDNDAQLSIVWSDKKYKYTPGDPSAENINVTLIEPSGKPSSVRPDIAEDGYCIYNLHNVQPGDWKLLIQYSTREAIGGTAGGFEFHTSIKTDLLLPANIKNGERFDIKIASRDDRQIDELSVKANISRPDYNIDEVLDRFAGELNSVQLDNDAENNQYTLLKKLRARKLQDESIDILPLKHLTLTSDFSGVDGDCSLSMDDTGNTGAYNVNVEIRGVDPVTKRPFKSLKAGTVIVE